MSRRNRNENPIIFIEDDSRKFVVEIEYFEASNILGGEATDKQAAGRVNELVNIALEAETCNDLSSMAFGEIVRELLELELGGVSCTSLKELKVIKPCPFCENDILEVVGNDVKMVACATNRHGCGATGPTNISSDEAIDLWNKATS